MIARPLFLFSMLPQRCNNVGAFVFQKAVLLCRFLQWQCIEYAIVHVSVLIPLFARVQARGAKTFANLEKMSKNAREKIRIGLHISFETQTNKQKYNERNKQHRSCCGK